jgi:hypothetical protein
MHIHCHLRVNIGRTTFGEVNVIYGTCQHHVRTSTLLLMKRNLASGTKILCVQDLYPRIRAVGRTLYSGDNGLAVRYCDARPESIAFVSISILESEFLVVSYRNSCVAAVLK